MKINPIYLFKILNQELGQQNWWPVDIEYHRAMGSDPRYEIIVGAILTQNTSWSNVEKALENLKLKKVFEIQSIVNANILDLQNMIKPSGFFKQKTIRIKNFTKYIYNNYNSDLDCFFDRELKVIRNELLSLNGIGPETADSILLYAGNFPIFVIDEYTKRICKRLPFNTNNSYYEIQRYFEKELSKYYSKQEITKIYKDLHALIVIFAKNQCKKNPKCVTCPLKKYCTYNIIY